MDRPISHEPSFFSAKSFVDEARILQFVLKEYNINMDDVQKIMEQKKIEKILSMHKYKIFQDKKDGRWKTTLPDSSKKSGRRLVAKTSYDDLIGVVVAFYSNAEKKEQLTLRKLYPEWLNYKILHTSASSYIKRITNDWNKYYNSNYIVDIPINKLTSLMLDEWAHTLIKTKSLTKRQYYNMTVIMRQSLEYAVKKYNNIIRENPFETIKIDKKMFEPTPKPKSNTQVFNKAEENKICQLALEKYNNRPKSIAGLAIIFNFNLGLRVGELVALRWSDIEMINGVSYIHIQRQEVKEYETQPDKPISKIGVKVVEHTKSQAGDRYIYLNKKAREILDMIKARNEKYGFCDEDYIFVNEFSNRLHAARVDTYLYNLCNQAEIPRKGSHKIRKTFASEVISTGMSINTVREMLGHESEITTLRNYCFDRNGDSENERLLDSI